MVEELGGQYTAAGRSHGRFSIELLILDCLGKQLTSKQASRRDFEANKQASKQRGVLLACLLISKSDGLGLTKGEDELDVRLKTDEAISCNSGGLKCHQKTTSGYRQADDPIWCAKYRGSAIRRSDV